MLLPTWIGRGVQSGGSKRVLTNEDEMVEAIKKLLEQRGQGERRDSGQAQGWGALFRVRWGRIQRGRVQEARADKKETEIGGSEGATLLEVTSCFLLSPHPVALTTAMLPACACACR